MFGGQRHDPGRILELHVEASFGAGRSLANEARAGSRVRSETAGYRKQLRPFRQPRWQSPVALSKVVAVQSCRSAYDARVMDVVTRYARSGDLQIAYQMAGDGPLDVLVVPRWFSNIDLDWELPAMGGFLTRMASFARLIQFDRRGAGMSGGIAGATPLEEQVDDVRAVLDAASSDQPALISIAEGCALAVLFAASHPDLVRALVLITPTPRVVRAPGYEWAQIVDERAAIVEDVVAYWGSSSPKQPWGGFAGHDERRRRQLARHRRLSMTPDAAAASLAMVGEVDVRDALASVQCPTLVLRRASDAYIATNATPATRRPTFEAHNTSRCREAATPPTRSSSS